MSWQRQVLASRGFLELGMFEDATLALEQMKAEPKDPATWILLAHAVRHAGNVEQMEMVLFKARAWHPRDPLILFKLACCASVTGRAYRVNREGFTGKGERMDGTSSSRAPGLLRDAVASPRTAESIDESGKHFRNKIPETLRPYSLCNG
jgi:hypothetical protein